MWKKTMLKKCEMTSPINEQVTPLSMEAAFCFKDAKKPEEVKKIRAHSYVCSVCNVPFSLCDSFADHLEAHDGDTSLECSICTESLDSKKEYYEHLIIHAKKYPKSCKICTKTYITWLRLKCHLDWHDKTFLCHLCDRTFVNKEHLDKHLLLHTVEEYRTCKICNKLESQNSCVQIAVHPKQPHTCSTCGKIFGKKSSLSAHQRMHRFPCQFCPKEFSLRADLICHIRCYHPEISFQTDLTSHLSGSHPESSIQIDLTSHLKASHPEASDKFDLTSRFNSSHPEYSDKIDLTSHFNSSHPEASDKIDLTSHFNSSHPEASDKIDLTSHLKVLIQRLPLRVTSSFESFPLEASFKANVSNSTS